MRDPLKHLIFETAFSVLDHYIFFTASAMNFQANEKVLCYHGPLIYQAKILKAEIWTGQDPSEGGFTGPHYFVHYQGWKATWDEWVPESRVLKLNDENIARQKALVAAAKSKGKEPAMDSKNGSGGNNASTSSGPSRSRDSGRNRSDDHNKRSTRDSSNAHPSTSANSSRGTKRSRDSMAGGTGSTSNLTAEEEEYLRKPEIKIVIPDSLKVQLVDDWENVTKKDLLVPLPKKPCVKDVLKSYREHVVDKKKNHSSKTSMAVVDEVLSGLELYFDKALGNNLLYRFERTQYLNAKKSHSAAAATAGESTSSTSTSTSTGNSKGKREVSAQDGQGDDKPPSEIYGAEHLLRLFVNLPAIIAHTTMDAGSVIILREHLDDFLQYLVKEKEKGKLFGRYEPASPAYHRISAV
ncbi:unnamed protein product [Sympodiomycopsis kandeliae]